MYALPHILMLLGILALFLAVERRSFRPMLILGEIVVLTLVFSLPKLIAMYETFGNFSRPWSYGEVNSFPLMVKLLFSTNQSITRKPSITMWNYCEYGAYVKSNIRDLRGRWSGVKLSTCVAVVDPDRIAVCSRDG